MNILMVYPKMPDNITNSLYIVHLLGKKATFPPIGLLTVAAMLPSEWNKKVVDLNFEELRKENLEWADFVFLSAMNVQAKSAKEVIRICNQHNVKVVAGGPMFTHEHEHFPGVAHFVLNEAEITLPNFLKDLELGTPKEIYTSSEYANVHQTPTPMWDLIDMKNYLYSIVQYSRGCPYLCDFCDVTTLYGRKPRVKTPQQVIAELNLLLEKGPGETILFADDNLIGNKNVLKKELLPALIEWRKRNPYAPGFTTQLTITLADDRELCELLLEAGFRNVLIGIESIDDASLIAMRKKQNAGRNILEVVKYLQSIGFIIIGTFIVGLDTDKETVFDDIITFIQRSGIVYIIVNVLKAPPGTELFERMKRENRLLTKFEFDEDKTNIVPIMDSNILYEGFKKILINTYSPNNVLQRIIQHQKDKNNLYKVAFPIKRRISFEDIFIAFKILIKLGIISTERKYFWKIILYTVRNNLNMLDNAVFHAALMNQYNSLLDNFLKKEKMGLNIYSASLPLNVTQEL